MERPYLPRLVDGLIQELLTELPDLRDYVELALRGGFPEAALRLSARTRAHGLSGRRHRKTLET